MHSTAKNADHKQGWNSHQVDSTSSSVGHQDGQEARVHDVWEDIRELGLAIARKKRRKGTYYWSLLDGYLIGEWKEPNFSSRYIVRRTNIHKLKYRRFQLDGNNLYVGWSNTFIVPRSLWNLHPLRYSKLSCTHLWAAPSNWTCFEQKTGLDDFQRSL